MLRYQIGAIKRLGIVGAAVVSAIAILMASTGSVARSQSTAPADHSPIPASGTPAPCGTVVDTWGAATADDVRVQLLGVQQGMIWGVTGTPAATPAATSSPVLTVDLEIANLGQETVRIDPKDVTVTTCSGKDAPPASPLTMKSPLGEFGPGETRRGEIQFPLDVRDAPAHLTIKIQEEHRTGAQISCPLALDLGTATTGAVSAGCNAQGGSGQSGAAGSAGSGVAPTATGGAGR